MSLAGYEEAEKAYKDRTPEMSVHERADRFSCFLQLWAQSPAHAVDLLLVYIANLERRIDALEGDADP